MRPTLASLYITSSAINVACKNLVYIIATNKLAGDSSTHTGVL